MSYSHLKNFQRAHFINLLAAQRHYSISLDTSQTGAGKTVVALALGTRLRLPMLVIAPPKLLPKWRREATKYNANVIDYLSSDNLLRSAFIDGDDVILPPYPLLLIIDECHEFKNNSDRAIMGAVPLARAVRQAGGNIHAMSATPADKVQHYSAIFNLLGIADVDEKTHFSKNSYSQFYTFARNVAIRRNCSDPADRQQVLLATQHLNPSPRYVDRDRCLDALLMTCLEGIRSNMEYKPINSDAANLFCNLEERSVRFIAEALEHAKAVLEGNPHFQEITTHLKKIEMLKLELFERIARQELEDPRRKVIVFLHYTETINALASSMADYSPLVMTGRIGISSRTQIIDEFNDASDTRRLLIANPKVGGTGVDLDDTHGSWPRTMILSPSFDTTQDVQSIGRVIRVTTKSVPRVRFLYVKGCEMEMRIIETHNTKSTVLRKTSNNVEMMYPSQYRSIDEQGNDYAND